MRAVVLALVLSLGAGTARATDELVDLNTATVEQLQTLPGIGPKRAEAIVDARTRRPFTRLTQLLEVRGIGKQTLKRLRPFVTVEAITSSRRPATPVSAEGGAGLPRAGPAEAPR